MSSNYPDTLDNTVSLPTRDTGDLIPTSDSNDKNTAIIELEKKLGVGSSNASTASTGEVMKKQSDGSTAWATDENTTDHTQLSNIGTKTHAQIDTHINATNNPHQVTKTQVGLGNVPNSDATQRANHSGTQVAATISDFNPSVDARITAQKGQSGGLASLDSGGKVPSSELPAIALADVSTVGSQAAQLALTAQEGDVAIRTDLNKTYIHNGGSAGTMSDWSELATPTDAVLSVAGRTGAVTLSKADVGLSNVDNTSDAAKPVSTATQTALDAKAATADLTAHTSNTSNPHAVTKAQVGLSNVDNTADSAKPISTATQSALDGKSAVGHDHTSSDVTDFTEAVQDAVAALLAAGTAVSLSYDDASNSLTINSTGGEGGGLDDEAVRDAIGVALLGSGLITVTVNDAADTITISTTATANDTDANLKNRANHTGEQALSTITGLQTALDSKAATSHTHAASQITDFDTEVANNTDVVGKADKAGDTFTGQVTVDRATAGKNLSIAVGASEVAEITSYSAEDADVAMTLHGPMYAHGLQMEPQFANDPAGLLSNDWVGYADSSYIFHDGTDDKLKAAVNGASASRILQETDIIDEDNMASDSATKVPTQQSVKAYVDASGGGGSGVSTVAKSGETGLTGDVTLSGGTDITLTQSGNDIEIAYSGSGGGGGGSSTPVFRFGSIFEGAMNGATSYTARFATLAGGNGTTTWTAGGMSINLFGQSDSYAGASVSMTSAAGYSLFGGNYGFTHGETMSLATPNGDYIAARGVGFGLRSNAAGIVQTKSHVAWIWEYVSSAWNHKISVGNGTTQSSTTITTDTSSFTNMYHIQVTGTTSAKFYKNGTLVGTLTTNIPTAADNSVAFADSNRNSSTVAQAHAVSMFEYAKEIV